MFTKISDYNTLPEIQCIYRIVFQSTGENYIGSTFNLKDRIRRHFYDLKTNTHHSWKLQRVFNNDFLENFLVEILVNCEELSKEELHNIEVSWIKENNNVEEGFNCIVNSKEYKKFKQTPEAIENFRKARSKKVIGFNLSTKEVENFASVSDAAKHAQTQSTNVSKCCKGDLQYIKGYKFIYASDFDTDKDYFTIHRRNYDTSEETNLKKSLASPHGKKVYQYDMEGNFIKEYRSRSFCEKENGIEKEKLRQIMPKKQSYNGFYYHNEKK